MMISCIRGLRGYIQLECKVRVMVNTYMIIPLVCIHSVL